MLFAGLPKVDVYPGIAENEIFETIKKTNFDNLKQTYIFVVYKDHAGKKNKKEFLKGKQDKKKFSNAAKRAVRFIESGSIKDFFCEGVVLTEKEGTKFIVKKDANQTKTIIKLLQFNR